MSSGAARPLVLLVTLLVVVLSGCEGGSEPSPATTTSSAPAPPTTYSSQQLRAALPGKADVPRAEKTTPGCPQNKEACSDDRGVEVEHDRTFTLEPMVEPSAVEQEADANRPSIDDFVTVSGRRFDTGKNATATAARARTVNAAYAGTFRTKAKDLEQGRYQPGIEGEGTITDVTVAGWRGLVVSRRLVLTSPDGAKSRPVIDAFLVVSDGTTVVQVTTALDAEKRGTNDAADLATRLAGEYVERLD